MGVIGNPASAAHFNANNRGTMQLQEFYDYMLMFYGAPGQYANAVGGPFTLDEVKEATARYLAIPTDHRPEFDGDTVDREHVRDIVLIMRGKEPWDYLFTPSLLNRNHLLREI